MHDQVSKVQITPSLCQLMWRWFTGPACVDYPLWVWDGNVLSVLWMRWARLTSRGRDGSRLTRQGRSFQSGRHFNFSHSTRIFRMDLLYATRALRSLSMAVFCLRTSPLSGPLQRPRRLVDRRWLFFQRNPRTPRTIVSAASCHPPESRVMLPRDRSTVDH